jgi:hypothetical protein
MYTYNALACTTYQSVRSVNVLKACSIMSWYSYWNTGTTKGDREVVWHTEATSTPRDSAEQVHLRVTGYSELTQGE